MTRTPSSLPAPRGLDAAPCSPNWALFFQSIERLAVKLEAGLPETSNPEPISGPGPERSGKASNRTHRRAQPSRRSQPSDTPIVT